MGPSAVLTVVTPAPYLSRMPTSGLELRAERRAADITVVDIAARMGLSRQAVHVIETRAIVTGERVTQYRQALADAIVASRERVA